MCSSLRLIAAWFLCVAALSAQAFMPSGSLRPATRSHLNMIPQAPPPALETLATLKSTSREIPASPVYQGIGSYLSRSSSMELSLQERKVPTKEEIAEKKRNFNLIFWGGGFVAPFLATVL
eukprot:scaffold2767_cov177-Amphora_coffeaeformis.AAC.17